MIPAAVGLFLAGWLFGWLLRATRQRLQPRLLPISKHGIHEGDTCYFAGRQMRVSRLPDTGDEIELLDSDHQYWRADRSTFWQHAYREETALDRRLARQGIGPR